MTRSCRALAFPSRYEGFGRTLVEALSLGTPVVAIEIAVIRDAVLRRQLVVDDWVDGVSALLHEGVLGHRLQQASRERAAQFSVNAMVDGYLDAAGLARWTGA